MLQNQNGSISAASRQERSNQSWCQGSIREFACPTKGACQDRFFAYTARHARQSHTHQQQGEPVLDLDHDPLGDTAPQLPTVPVQLAGQQGPQPHAEQPVPVA